jgi:toxin CcdB
MYLEILANRAHVIPFVVSVQSAFYDNLRRRVVIPLVDCAALGNTKEMPDSLLNPKFVIHGLRVVLNPLEIVSVPVGALGEKVGSLVDKSDSILMSLDELFSRAWNQGSQLSQGGVWGSSACSPDEATRNPG